MDIYCDGLCEPTNPNGHATWGFVVVHETDGSVGFIHSANGYIGHGDGMTNNLAEYTAVIQALVWAYREGHKGFVIKTDSQLVVKQVTGEWAIKAQHIQPLADRVRKGMKTCEVTSIQWVPREQNVLADEQSRIAYRKAAGQSEDDTALYAQAIRDLDAMDTELPAGFELDFVVSNLARVNQYGDRTRFSPKQKAVIVRLVGTYLGQDREDELTGQIRIPGT